MITMRSAIVTMIVASAAHGESGTLGLSHSLLIDSAAVAAVAVQDEQPAAEPASDAIDTAPRFGEEGHWSWSLQFGTAFVHDSTDFNLTWNPSVFLADDFELVLSLGGWYFDQDDGDDAGGGSFSFGFRIHALGDEAKDWTGYLELGIGVLGTSDEVPVDGTEFNFLPRAGVGATFRLGDGPERFDVGVRWHHISNATLGGSDDNPARDAPMVYFGVIVPF